MKIKLLIGSVVIVSILGFFLALNPFDSDSVENMKTPPAKSYTLKDVAKHKTASNCWMVINKKVYNATKFIKKHPGGKAILKGCGKDATKLFNTRPMGSGTKHSPAANKVLKSLYMGPIK